MKEATGELNMTVITVVAIAAIAAVFYFVVWPMIQVNLVNNTCEAECGKDNFQRATRATDLNTYDCKCTGTNPLNDASDRRFNQ